VRGRRGPIIVGAIAAIVSLLVILFLVLPKLGQVTEAQQDLEEAEAQQDTLESRLSALEQAREEAPQNEAEIREVDRQVPPTADLAGLLLLLRNAATQSGVQVVSLTPAAPSSAEDGDFSSIQVPASGEGSYFAVVDYLYSIETLPRAATVGSLDLTPVEGSGLTFAATITLYTSDVSAGPGSEPGPTEQGSVPGA
jgi:Tfp pilus assembly protein PilO